MDLFYGTVTTTLVVLSSFTLAIFQFLTTAIIKKVKDSHSRLSKYTNPDGDFEYKCNIAIKYDLAGRYDKLQASFKPIIKYFELEFTLLLFVVLLSAFSVLLVLLHGIYQFERITIKVIFSVNLIAIIIYIYAFIALISRWFVRKSQVKKHINNINDFLLKIQIEKKVGKRFS